MLRIKIPQGILTGAQLDAMADVAERYSRGFGHITTRQNIQLHFVKLHDAEPAMRELAAAGLTTREACGNSVRNITACPYAGVSADEAFDVTPYAEALTRYLLRHPLSSVAAAQVQDRLRRLHDAITSSPAINDIGWNARVQNIDGRAARLQSHRRRRHGDDVTRRQPAARVPAGGEMFDVREAVLRVFHRLGDYKHKQRNRLKFLVKARVGRFHVEYERERAELRPRRPRCRSIRAARRSRARPPGRRAAPSVAEIASRATTTAVIGPGIVPKVEPRLVLRRAFASGAHQRAAAEAGGYSVVIVTIARRPDRHNSGLWGARESYGDGTIRVTTDQNLLFRWVRNENVESFYRAWRRPASALPGAGTLSDVTSCPGAESCKLAVTQSRGLGRVLADYLLERPDYGAEFRAGHQDQRLPERLWSAPRCRHRLPGQPEEGRRGAGAAVLRDGRRRLRRRITTFGRLAAKVPARRCPGARAPREAVPHGPARRRESALAFFRRVDLAR